MARVLVLSSAANTPFDVWKHSSAFLLRHSAELDPFGKHQLTDDPDEADVILFAEMGTCGKFAEMVRAHPYYRKFPAKCFVFDSGDVFFPVLRGIYASLRKEQYCKEQTRTGYYLYLIENAYVLHRPITGNEPYLASFVGSMNTHPVRKRFLEFGREDILVRDTSSYSGQTTYHGAPAERARFWSEYADSIANARFSLCPRGRGAGSIRLFESMKMGRACVIVSDAWYPMDGIPWGEYSLFVAERDAGRIPEMLEERAGEAATMGMRAREVWEEHFSERARFHRMVEACLDIVRSGGRADSVQRMKWMMQALRPANLRWYLSSKRDLYRNTGRVYW